MHRAPTGKWVGTTPPLTYPEADMILRALRCRYMADRLGLDARGARDYALRHPGDFRRTFRSWLAASGSMFP